MADKLGVEVENNDNDFADISFEELLAQEKKDAFWLVSCLKFNCYFIPSVVGASDIIFHLQAEEWES